MRVVKNFKDISSSSVVSDDLMLDKSSPEDGGFYSFGGGWTVQRNVGVNWVTNYDDVENSNVTRLKACKLGTDTVLLFELWTRTAYTKTYIVKLDSELQIAATGEIKGRLGRRDDSFEHDNHIISVEGDGN